jgi:hypothetical protein
MRTEATVESSEASLREAFQQLQGGSNAIPWWERRNLAQSMSESFVVGTASETAFLLVNHLAKDPKWEVRVTIAELLPIAARNVAAHGGLLRLESREDEGTTVTILLPRESQ